ncbi:GntR family transcriptional regulator [Rhizobium mongolense]|uniref:DNA-binding GntR family transcriptional regulator n=1 Tax=Rhizobium mongolense TaxID=57676 RepID=A0A7W6WEG6_9HYPH|nr:GntR family transcriptional regulator [Rhizobium mongolense]MBB4274850.1 DNA-binding GntR family transcriptional regulator [Rhizobium mongolense]
MPPLPAKNRAEDPEMNGEPLPASAVDILTHALRRRILSGDFRPGEFLRDVKMCEEHSTSRHTFRTAAQVLVTQGLLRQIPNRGFVVPEFGPDDIVDITRVRGAIESEAIRLIVLTGVIPSQALEAVDVMHSSTLSADRSLLVAADRDFHRAIIAASGSTRLKRTYSDLEGEIELLLAQRQDFYATAEEMAEEHERLINSLRSRHYDTARDAFQEHWEDLQIKLLDQR